MIGRLRGQLIWKRPTELVIEAGGVGYEALIPVSTFEKLPDVGVEVVLITHLHVREDALQLYAFASAAERELFRVLIGVSGIGPKLALAVLSGLTVEQFKEAIGGGNAERLQSIPGIGKRTAERLVVELKDRLGLGEDSAREAAEAASLGVSAVVFADAVATLTALGYTSAMAQRAVRKAVEELGPAPGLEDLVRCSLAALTG